MIFLSVFLEKKCTNFVINEILGSLMLILNESKRLHGRGSG